MGIPFSQHSHIHITILAYKIFSITSYIKTMIMYYFFIIYFSMLLLLLLSHFSHVRLSVTPSLGFSRQEHWSGLPFPSPMHKSEKWKWSCSVMSDSSRPPAAYQAPPSMGFSRQEYCSGVPLPSLFPCEESSKWFSDVNFLNSYQRLKYIQTAYKVLIID